MMLSDTPRIYTALAQWLACMLYLWPVKERLHGWKLGTLAGVFLVVQSVFLMVTDDVPLWLWAPCMLMAIGFMFVFIWGVGRTRLPNACYICIRAFVLSEWMAAFEWQIHSILYLQGASFWQLILLLIVVYGGSLLIFAWLGHYFVPDDFLYRIVSWRGVGVALAVGIMVFVLSNLGFLVDGSYAYTDAMSVFSSRTLIDFSGVAILYVFHLYIFNSYYHMKVDALEMTLQKQYQQYQQSKSNIELINHKYHDLKHQIALLRKNVGDGHTEYLDRMEEEIKKYEMENKTGNAVLDVILTDKSYYCLQRDITLSCVADGALLNFIDDMDICTIFGNALDNAIEGLDRIRDPQKRLINVLVCRQNSFLFISFENYCENDVTFRDGLPETTKEDNLFHGYGLSSIRSTVRRYQGTMTVQVENNWFELVLLIPLQE